MKPADHQYGHSQAKDPGLTFGSSKFDAKRATQVHVFIQFVEGTPSLFDVLHKCQHGTGIDKTPIP